MEKVKIEGSNARILKIELNSAGDYTAISADSPMLFDEFVEGFQYIITMADKISTQMAEIERKYEGMENFSSATGKILEISALNVDFSKEAVSVIERIFGSGTVRKYFRDIYEEVPDFLPDADCIMDFFVQIIPVMEKLFSRKVERQKEASKNRMAKYQPQNYRKQQKVDAVEEKNEGSI